MVERIDIIITERGSRRVRRGFDDIGRSARGAQGGVRLLTRALGAVGVGFAVRQFARLSDTYTGIRNRLRLVTSSTDELRRVQGGLLAIANRTRTDFEAVAQLYQRTSSAVNNLGISSQRVANFVESLSQATIVSGASSIEASNAIRQLTQGLAAGALRGEEFRSVSEQLPFVLDVVSQSLGITRGAVRELAFSGQLTAQTLIEAFEDMSGEVSTQFGQLNATIGQAFTVFNNQLITFIGGTNEATGASTILAQTILLAAENIDIVALSVAAAATALGTVFAARAVGSAITAVRAFTVAIAANPVLTLASVAGILAIAGALQAFGTDIRTITSDLLGLQTQTQDTESAFTATASATQSYAAATRDATDAVAGQTTAQAGLTSELRRTAAAAAANASFSAAGTTIRVGRRRGGPGLGDQEIAGFDANGVPVDSSGNRLSPGVGSRQALARTRPTGVARQQPFGTVRFNPQLRPRGLNQGGSFNVAGRGGVDRNVLALNGRPVARVSRGERVDVTQRGETGRGGQVVINQTIVTPDADSFQRSGPQVAARIGNAVGRQTRRNG